MEIANSNGANDNNWASPIIAFNFGEPLQSRLRVHIDMYWTSRRQFDFGKELSFSLSVIFVCCWVSSTNAWQNGILCIVSFIQLFCSSKYRHSAQPHQFMRFLGFTFIINTQSQTTTYKSISPKGIFENSQTHCTICHQTKTVRSKCDWNLNVYESGILTMLRVTSNGMFFDFDDVRNYMAFVRLWDQAS